MITDSLRIYLLALNKSSLLCLSFAAVVLAQPTASFVEPRTDGDGNTKNPVSDGILRDTSYLPAQIGGIVGAYAVSLVLVAIILLALSKKRREHINGVNDEIDFEDNKIQARPPLSLTTDLPVPNFSYPSPTRSEFDGPKPYIYPSPTSTVGQPGVSPLVDQRIVAADRAMAQQQLEDMYKYVMEHEDAKQRGIVLDAPVIPGATPQPQQSLNQQRASTTSGRTTLSKKERSKPANLNLSLGEEKPQSRTSSLLSALRSPKKKAMKGLSISSPMMTPQSATFPRQESQELSAIPPRQYAPPPPPPVPTDQVPYHVSKGRGSNAPLTPDLSPESVQSIDERLGAQLGQMNHHNRNISQAPTEVDPESATSERSSAPLVGLPSSPKPGARFPSLPASPKPGATFSRPNAPSAVRTGGALPLRAYEPSMNSPSVASQSTKQTVFERKGPLSPGGGRTPFTATAVPYSPYQPFTPCMPMTPSLVTKEDRKRMKRMVPKTPTLEMVQSSEDVW